MPVPRKAILKKRGNKLSWWEKKTSRIPTPVMITQIPISVIFWQSPHDEVLTCTVAKPLLCPVLMTRSSSRGTWEGGWRDHDFICYSVGKNKKSVLTPPRLLSQSSSKVKWVRQRTMNRVGTKSMLQLPSPLHTQIRCPSSPEWAKKVHIRGRPWLQFYVRMVMVKTNLPFFWPIPVSA